MLRLVAIRQEDVSVSITLRGHQRQLFALPEIARDASRSVVGII